MSDLHDLQARVGDLGRAIVETDDQHGNLLNGLEAGLSQLREQLVGTAAANDRLTRENTELRAIAEQLLVAIETKPADSLHDKLAALDGQLHGLLELSGVQAPVNRTPVNGSPVNEVPVTAGSDGGASSDSAFESTSEVASEVASESAGGPFEEIRDRMRALSSQLLAPSTAPSAEPEAAQAQAQVQAQAQAQVQAQGQAQGPAPIPLSDAGPPPKPAMERHARLDLGAPHVFDRPLKALAAKAQNVLPKVRLRFDAETSYALNILRRIRGNRQPFGIEEVRELINGKFGLSLTDRDDAQLSASLANQDGLTRGSRGGDPSNAPSWRFESG
jgi:hypothetical protein